MIQIRLKSGYTEDFHGGVLQSDGCGGRWIQFKDGSRKYFNSSDIDYVFEDAESVKARESALYGALKGL